MYEESKVDQGSRGNAVDGENWSGRSSGAKLARKPYNNKIIIDPFHI